MPSSLNMSSVDFHALHVFICYILETVVEGKLLV